MLNKKVLVACSVFCGVLLLLYAVAITIFFALECSKAKSAERIKCETYGCVRAALQIVNYIDESIDPCEDFYQFANGRYIKGLTEEIDDWDAHSLPSTALKSVNNRIGTLLSEPLYPDEWKAFRSTKTFYQSCLKQLNDLGSFKFDFLREWPVLQGTAWPSHKFDLIGLIRALRLSGLDTNSIFTLNVGIDPLNNTNRRLEINKGNYDRPNEESDDEYQKKSYNIAASFIDENDENAKTALQLEMKRVLTFEEKLVHYKNLSDIDSKRIIRITTVVGLQKLYPYLNWTDYINAILPSGLHVTENEPIMNWDHQFFENLGGILNTTSNYTLANYIVWRAIYGVHRMSTNKMGINLRDHCINLTSEKFSFPVALLYSQKYFNETSRQAVINLVENVRHAFIDMLGNVTWMDNDTRRKAIEKAKNIVAFVGYPSGIFESHILDEYYGPLEKMESSILENTVKWNIFNNNHMFNSLRRPANRSGWETALVLKPNENTAFYSPRGNMMIFPIAILHEKIFSVDRPNYINYARLGEMAGHEMTHGFDSHGGYIHLNGNVVLWWNFETKSRFIEKARCYVQQYRRYTYAKKQVNEQTLNENIADNGGIKAAYYAYQKWIKVNGPESLVPGIKYNEKQLFWISYAQIMGEVLGKNVRMDQISGDVHATREFRVNGVVSNRREFADDFGCPVGSKMNPEEKCKMW